MTVRDAAVALLAELTLYTRHGADCGVHVVPTEFEQPVTCTCGLGAFRGRLSDALLTVRDANDLVWDICPDPYAHTEPKP